MTKKIAGYSYDAISNTLTMTAAFAKRASNVNSAEYKIVLQLRNDNPDMKLQKSDPKTPSNRPLNITYAKMEDYIKQCRDSKDRLETFKKVKNLSKIQASPYKYVKTWFLDNHANYSEQPEFDAEGFVVVKTKRQMEAEAKKSAEVAADLVQKIQETAEGATKKMQETVDIHKYSDEKAAAVQYASDAQKQNYEEMLAEIKPQFEAAAD